MLLVAATAAVAALIAGSSLAAKSAKEGTFTGKIKFEGKITQQISVGEGDRYLTFSFVEEGTSSSDPSVKSHCLGVAHDIDGTLERRGFCVDTDKERKQRDPLEIDGGAAPRPRANCKSG